MPTIITRGAASANGFGWAVASLGEIYWIGFQNVTFSPSANSESLIVTPQGNIFVGGYYQLGSSQNFYMGLTKDGAPLTLRYTNLSGSLAFSGNSLAINSAGNVIATDSNFNIFVFNDQITLTSTSRSSSFQFGNAITVNKTNGNVTIPVIFLPKGGSGYLEVRIFQSNLTTGVANFRIDLSSLSNINSIGSDSIGNTYLFCGVGSLGIIKLNGSTIQFAKRFGDSSWTNGTGTVSADNNLIITSTNNGNIVTAKINSVDGSVMWQRQINGGSANYSNILSVSTDLENNVYIIPFYSAMNTSGTNVFKYNSSGVLQWQRQIQFSSATAEGSQFRKLVVNNLGSMVLSGYRTTSSNQSPKPLVMKLPSDGSKTGTYNVGFFTFSYSVLNRTTSTVTGVSGQDFSTSRTNLTTFNLTQPALPNTQGIQSTYNYSVI